MRPFIRFQTDLRAPHNHCRLGLFYATCTLQQSHDLPDYAEELLEESLKWFNRNLTVPRLPSRKSRCVFWFRTDANELLRRVWPLVALMNEAGLYVHHRTTSRPGKIIYHDNHQIAAIPDRRKRNKLPPPQPQPTTDWSLQRPVPPAHKAAPKQLPEPERQKKSPPTTQQPTARHRTSRNTSRNASRTDPVVTPAYQ
jgi:hypothetical protein